jgi:hypothetical protein
MPPQKELTMQPISSIRFVLFGLMVGLILVFCTQSFAQVGVAISVNFAPPDLPVYEQPLCPGPDYIWTPGYWAWDDEYGYYWVPGTWVLAPEPNYYWTPAYWAWEGSSYRFFPGYWGPVVGFYGGIDYGYGYFGHGYEGGRWDRGHFYYNRSVTNVNVTEIHNVYNTTIVNRTVNRVSYNGGNGGISARPSAQEETAMRERHIPAVSAQTQHVQEARSNPEMRASSNRGRPPIAATVKPGDFHQGAVAAREGGAVHGPVGGRQEGRAAEQAHAPAQQARNARVPEPPASPRTEERQPARNENSHNEPARNENARSENTRPTYTHPSEIPRPEPHAAPNTGNTRTDQKYQKQQEKLANQQAKDRQKLQQRQDQEHQQVARQQANGAQQQQKQQMEQRHQQQTQQMMQRHEQQSQKLESRQQPHQQQAPPPVHANSHPPEPHKQ